MSGKARFKIPTGNEMVADTSKSQMNPMSMFASYKQKKTEGSNQSKPDSAPSASSANTAKQSISNGVNSLKAKQANTAASANIFAPKPRVANVKTSAPPSLPATATAASSSARPSSSGLGKTVMMTDPQRPTAPPAATASTSTESSTTTTGKSTSSNSIIVNYRQRGNPILKHIRNVVWEYGSIVPDYVMGKANCALFLSLRYHQLNPEYLHNRLKELGKGYDLRVLLVHVDVTDPHHLLRDLAKICILADCTLILAFSNEEAGRYLESYKVYENKPAEALMEKSDQDYISKLIDSLTTLKSVNKTDCMTLSSTFGSVEKMMKASKEDLSLCPGIGPQKAQRLYDVFHEPFLKSRKRLKPNSDNTETGDQGSSPEKQAR